MEISYLAVIVAAVLKFLIGWVWYTVLFGKQWQQLSGTSSTNMADMMPALIVEAIGDLIMAYVLARFVAYNGFGGIGGGLLIGFMAWLGFVATVMANQIFYERKPQQLVVINAGYLLVSLLVMGAILGVWHG